MGEVWLTDQETVETMESSAAGPTGKDGSEGESRFPRILSDSFQRADGAPTVAETGQPWSTAGSGSPAIRSHKFVCTVNGFGYLGTQLDQTPRILRLKARCLPGTIAGSGVTIACSSNPDGVAGITGTINNSIHCYLLRSGVAIQKRITPNAGTFRVIFTVTIATVVTTIPVDVPFNASVAAFQALVNATALNGRVTVGGATKAWTLTFIGDQALTNVTAVTTDVTNMIANYGAHSVQAGNVFVSTSTPGDGTHNEVQLLSLSATMLLTQVNFEALDTSIDHTFEVAYAGQYVAVAVDGQAVASFQDADFAWLVGRNVYFEPVKNTGGLTAPNDFDEWQLSSISGDGAPDAEVDTGQSAGEALYALAEFIAKHTIGNPTASYQGNGLVAYKGQGALEARLDEVNGAGALILGGDSVLYRLAANAIAAGAGDDFKVDGLWNSGRMRFGSNYVWVDANGALRIKPSAPTSDLDGSTILAADPNVLMPWQVAIDLDAPPAGGTNFGANAAYRTWDSGPFGGYIDNLCGASFATSTRSWDTNFSAGTWTLWVWYDKGPAGGKIDVGIGGITVVTIDTYAASPSTGALSQTFAITSPFTTTSKKRVQIALNAARNASNTTGWQTRVRHIALTRSA